MKIELDGSAAGVASEAFRIRASDCVIKGLVINRFGGNSILRNSIFSNDGLGIDLDDDGATPNDPDDEDTGPNELQNKPGLISAENAGGETTVKGTLNSGPNETFKVRFYSNP